MTPAQRHFLALASRLLEYPDAGLFADLNAMRRDAVAFFTAADESGELAALTGFIDGLLALGQNAVGENYVATFDHDPSASPYLAWHRYGNDRGQGKAMAALNGLYRQAGFEPVPGTMPDYLPRMLEFMAVADNWAIEVLLDGFGPELAALAERLAELQSPHAPLLGKSVEILRIRWPDYFRPRVKPDPTARPMANPEPELPLFPDAAPCLSCNNRLSPVDPAKGG